MPLIVFEGIDGSGKTSQAQALASRLVEEKHRVFLTSQPTKGPIGTLVRQIFELQVVPELPTWRTMMHLFQADAEMHQVQIRKELEEGKVVICDRYWFSMLAYQTVSAVRAGEPRQEVMSQIEQMNRHMVTPKVTFIFDVSVDKAMERIQKDGYAKRDFLVEVKRIYDQAEPSTGNTIIRLDTEKYSYEKTKQVVYEVGKVFFGW